MASERKPIDIMDKYQRVVMLLDMDCFYCQIEEKLNPDFKGKPIAVVQHNSWQGGGIIAVNYLARAKGVKRHMRGDEAKSHCADIVLVPVPTVRSKADLSRYRTAGKIVCAVLKDFTSFLEKASVDEFYLDITTMVLDRLKKMHAGAFELKAKHLQNTYVVGHANIGEFMKEVLLQMEADGVDRTDVKQSDIKLLIGASIANEMREAVLTKTGFECSVGIAHNKILAKLACGINKPNKQTILPIREIQQLFSTLPLKRIKGLGGKFGEEVCEKLNIKFVGDIVANYCEKDLRKKFNDKIGYWLYLIAQGIDLEPVVPRYYSQSIACSKKFAGLASITALTTLYHWLNELASDLCDRLDEDIIENCRQATQMAVVFIQEIEDEDVQSTRRTQLVSYSPDVVANTAVDVIKNNTDQFLKAGSENVLNYPIKFIALSVGKFRTLDPKNTLRQYFQKKPAETVTGENATTDLQRKPKSTSVLRKPAETVTGEIATTELESKPKSISVLRKPAQDVTIRSFFANFNPNLNNENTEQIPHENVKNDFVLAEATNGTEVDIARSQAADQQLDGIIEVGPKFNPDDYIEFCFADNYEPVAEDYFECERCLGTVLKLDMQAHFDFHFATDLQNKLRQEERTKKLTAQKSSILAKRKQIPTKAISKKYKTCQETITKYLREMPAAVNPIEQGDTYICEMCGECLPKSKEEEHNDYHFALNIQESFNSRVFDKDEPRPSTSKDM